MSLGLHENRVRRRRRFWWAVTKWSLALAAILAAGAYSYRIGSQLAARDVTKAEQRIAKLTEEVAGLERQSSALARELEKSKESIAAWRARYEREVPTGFVKQLMALVQQKLDAGADEERLAFLVSAAEKPRRCDETPETKRFIVTTSLQKGANDAVSFAERSITVTAQGTAARDAEGNIEAWFDPNQPITVAFTQLGGKTVTAEGSLPLHRSIVLGANEYRFSFLPGARGFLSVTADRCDYP